MIRPGVLLSPVPELIEHVQVKEVHGPQNQNDSAHFDAERFYGLLVAGNCPGAAQRERGVPHVDQVESRQQKLIYRVGQLLVAVEDVLVVSFSP